MDLLEFTRRLAITVGLLAAVPAAQAQLGLPVRPALPGVGLPGDLTRPLRLPEAPLAELAGRRLRQVDELLRRHAEQLEPDPAGQPVVRGELLLVAPGDALLAEARRRGYALLRERRIEGLDERWVVLRPPPGVSLADARAALLAVDPQATIDFNHLYLPAGEPSAGSSAPATAAPRGVARIGLVDSGVEASHPALRGLALQRQGCGGALHPQAHGTAVASLLVGRAEGFGGAAAGATLYAADVYCGVPTGGAVDAVAEALAWLARERVAVVNLSLVGPPNRLLERLVAALVARGHLLVAAVGNDGPAAPPLYPAAYPGVVGVTAVNAARRRLPEAARGPQVALAAPGAELAVAQAGGEGYASARGTSFAAPLVAGLLAQRLAAPDPAAARRALDALAREAIDLGASGRDDDYGWGLVGEALRSEPRRLRATAPLR